MNLLSKLIFFVSLTSQVLAQNFKTPEYVSLSKQHVYDVEIIVFAYNTALPNIQTYNNKPIFDTSLAYELMQKPEDLPLVQKKQDALQDDQYTINIEGKEDAISVLAWFEHSPEAFQLNSIWDKLQKQASIIPLVHRAWRQPETLFDSPQFIKINSLQPPENTLDNEKQTVLTPNASESLTVDNKTIYPNNTILGEVALSKGRYLHFSHQLNLFKSIKQYEDDDDEYTQNQIFSLTEREQVKSGELHYFDNPWFGTLVKITKYNGETQDE